MLKLEQPVASLASATVDRDIGSSDGVSLDVSHRLQTKKKIIVGNISKYVSCCLLFLNFLLLV